MRLWVLTMIAAAALSATAGTAASLGGAPQPGTRGPVIQTDAPAPTPTRAPIILNA